MTRFVGISIMPEFFQVEGRAALDNIVERAGATAIVTSPCVMEPADKASGTWEPPVKGAMLDREIWGMRGGYTRVAPSFAHNTALYNGLRYQPPSPNDLTRRDGHLLADFIAAAKQRGFAVHLRIQAAAPPGYRAQFSGIEDEDEPRLPDGRTSHDRVDKNGSLASPEIKAYVCALLRDLCAEYPDVDGFHVDWAEYPPYSIDSVFFDFSDHAMAAARRHGFDVERMRRDSQAVMDGLLGAVSASTLALCQTPATAWPVLLRIVLRYPGFLDLLRLKTLLVSDLLAEIRGAVGPDKQITPMSFPPPWSVVSGLDYAVAAQHSSAIALKLIPSHWPMMLRHYGDAIVAANSSLDERVVVRALGALLAFTDTPLDAPLSSFSRSADESFIAGTSAQTSMILQAQTLAGDTPVLPLVHSAGSTVDFENRLALAYAGANGGVWVNRYGFLTNEKLDAIGRITNAR